MGDRKKVTRRGFVNTAAGAFAGIAFFPSNTISGLGHKSPGDKLNIAIIGVGGRGGSNLAGVSSENIVALCDVNETAVSKAAEKYPLAKRYSDFRNIV